MHSITTLLSIAAFSLHILLGCGWHLAHGASDVQFSSDHFDGHQLSCSGHAEQQSTDSTPASPEECSGPQCFYLAVGQAELSPANDIAIIMPATLNHQIALGHASAIFSGHSELGIFQPHVRRHLALRHFLN